MMLKGSFQDIVSCWGSFGALAFLNYRFKLIKTGKKVPERYFFIFCAV